MTPISRLRRLFEGYRPGQTRTRAAKVIDSARFHTHEGKFTGVLIQGLEFANLAG